MIAPCLQEIEALQQMLAKCRETLGELPPSDELLRIIEYLDNKLLALKDAATKILTDHQGTLPSTSELPRLWATAGHEVLHELFPQQFPLAVEDNRNLLVQLSHVGQQRTAALNAKAQAETQRDAMFMALTQQACDRKEAEDKIRAEASAQKASWQRDIEDLRIRYETAREELDRKGALHEQELEALRSRLAQSESNELKAKEERDIARRNAERLESQCAIAGEEVASMRALARSLREEIAGFHDRSRQPSGTRAPDVQPSVATTEPDVRPVIKRECPDPEDQYIRLQRPRTGRPPNGSDSTAVRGAREAEDTVVGPVSTL